jgi:hypothetical protein
LDDDPENNDPDFCPGGAFAGDAVIDVDDNDTTDDVVIREITHVETDYIKRAGGPPTFRIWTGPRYRFNANGSARSIVPSATAPALCNEKFLIELSNNETFSSNVIRSSALAGPWMQVSRTEKPECYGTWKPNEEQWNSLKGTRNETRVHYRVLTRDAGMANERNSTLPMNGIFTVPPAYVIVNDTGRP